MFRSQGNTTELWRNPYVAIQLCAQGGRVLFLHSWLEKLLCVRAGPVGGTATKCRKGHGATVSHVTAQMVPSVLGAPRTGAPEASPHSPCPGRRCQG